MEMPVPNIGIRLPISEAADRVFVQIPEDTDTPRAWVGQIIEDKQGFLWFGTRDGLDRYDGYQFRHYPADPSDGRSLSSAYVYALRNDASGRIWIGADNFLNYFDPSTETFHRFSAPPSMLGGFIKSIDLDREGTLWFSTSHGLTRYDPADGKLTRYQHDPNSPSTLGSNLLRSTLEAKDGTFWVATNLSVEAFDRRTGKVTESYLLKNPLQDPVRSGTYGARLLEDHLGKVWVASASNGLAFIDRQRKRLEFLALGPESESEPGAWALLEDSEGALWVGTENGLLRLDRDRKGLTRYRHDPRDPDSLTADLVIALFEDREDGIWAGTADGGVVRFSETPPLVRRYRNLQGAVPGLGTDEIRSAYKDARGTIWAGGRGTVSEMDSVEGRETVRVRRIGGDDITSIAEDRLGHLWFGIRNGGVARFDRATERIDRYRLTDKDPSQLDNDDIRTLHVDHGGRLWLGNAAGLFAYDTRTNGFRACNSDEVYHNPVNAIAEDAHGVLWLGTVRSGVHRFDPETGDIKVFRHSKATHSLSYDWVTSILVDRSGIVWVGTLNGLNRLDPASGEVRAFFEADGLAGNSISGIAEDLSGDLWIATNRGLSRLTPKLNDFRNYHHSDGVPDGLTGVWASPSGQLLLGSQNGLATFFAETAQETHFIPPVVLTQLQLGDKPVTLGADSPLTASISTTKTLVLSYRQNSPTFEFAALSYAAPELTRYRYWLEGFESGWNEMPGARRLVRYTTIAPGQYTFHVQARTDGKGWIWPGADMRLVILPPWWSTWWFRTACTLAAVAIARSAYRFRLARVAHNLDLQFQERLKERTRIAQELHDTLLQNIAGLCLQMGGIAKTLPPDLESTQERFKDLRKQGEQCLREARQAVWNVRSLGSESRDWITELRVCGERMVSGSDTRFVINVEGDPSRAVPGLRDQLVRIGQEAIANAARHAHADKIEVCLDFDPDRIRMQIADNGDGFDVQNGATPGHFGLTTMRERACDIGASITISSELMRGTLVDVVLPVGKQS